jgi:uncharacterized RmlC-like cupin family protein
VNIVAALRALLAGYFERMKAIAESHGGTVEKFIGDAVMAVFGVPRVHEDDALRAVHDGELVTLFGARLQERVVASPGDFVYIPPDVPHLVANLSDAPARALVAHSAPDDQAGIVLLPDLDALAP